MPNMSDMPNMPDKTIILSPIWDEISKFRQNILQETLGKIVDDANNIITMLRDKERQVVRTDWENMVNVEIFMHRIISYILRSIQVQDSLLSLKEKLLNEMTHSNKFGDVMTINKTISKVENAIVCEMESSRDMALDMVEVVEKLYNKSE